MSEKRSNEPKTDASLNGAGNPRGEKVSREFGESQRSIDSMNVPPPTGTDRPMMVADSAGNETPNEAPPMPA